MSRRLRQAQGRLDSFLANGDSLLLKIDVGRGSLGLLVNDPSLHRNSDSLLVELHALIVDVRAHPKKLVNVRLF
jgi:phospholipid/cholesterol/gamma-HCH transport system substrate-binding protein